MKDGLKKALKITGITLGSILGVVILAVGSMIIYLSASEYKPADIEQLEIVNPQSKKVELNKDYSVFSWNVGYCALDEDSDFFMDGGKGVRPRSTEQVTNNISALANDTLSNNPDFIFYQEVDTCSDRSGRVNQKEAFREKFTGFSSTYALNYKVGYVPYPLPTIGKVESGLLTFSKYHVESSIRKSLPNKFSWPLRLANLKRCLDISRLPIEGSEKQLVLINLHLEAYDSGDAKVAQTKMLLELLDAEYKAGNYVIAGGDFNQTFSSLDQEKYPVKPGEWKPDLVDEEELKAINYTCLVQDDIPTCRLLNHPYDKTNLENNTFYVIDGLIASNNVDVTSFGAVDYQFKNTDHNPTFVNFKLK